MSEIIPITNDMSRVEKMKTRKRNREVAYEEMKQYYKDNPVPKLSSEEREEAKQIIRSILLENLQN